VTRRRYCLALAAFVLALCATVSSVASADETSSFRIVLIADLNERYGDTYYRQTVHAAIDRTKELSPDLIMIAGDMVAGQRNGLDYEAMWRVFRRDVLDELEGTPIAVTPGNHDASAYDSFAEERHVYRTEAFDDYHIADHEGVEMVDDDRWPFAYSFTIGPAFVVSLDVTAKSSLDHEQVDWLEAQLESDAAAAKPVRLVFGHLPLYPLAQGRESDWLLNDEDIRERVESLLAAHDVDYYISGHHHAFYPARHPEHGFGLLSVGCLGGGPRALLGHDRPIEDLDDPEERSFVVLDIVDGQIAALAAYRGPDFTLADRIDIDALPDAVGEGPLRMTRDEGWAPGTDDDRAAQ